MYRTQLGIVCISLITIWSCKNQSKDAGTYITRYPNGMIHQVGKIRKDSTLIDTLKSFWENQKIQEIKVYDTNGILNGLTTLFDSTGNKIYEINFKDGKPLGYTYIYYDNGAIKTKAYRLSNGQVGNTYHFDKNGMVDTFSFLSFRQEAIIEKVYAEGKLVRQHYESFFIDTILPTSNDKYLNIGFILSNPPNESVSLIIYKVGMQEKLYDSIQYRGGDELDSVSIQIDRDLKSLKLVCRRYDSLHLQSTVEDGLIQIQKE